MHYYVLHYEDLLHKKHIARRVLLKRLGRDNVVWATFSEYRGWPLSIDTNYMPRLVVLICFKSNYQPEKDCNPKWYELPGCNKRKILLRKPREDEVGGLLRSLVHVDQDTYTYEKDLTLYKIEAGVSNLPSTPEQANLEGPPPLDPVRRLRVSRNELVLRDDTVSRRLF
jgi:hypothetical protein